MAGADDSEPSSPPPSSRALSSLASSTTDARASFPSILRCGTTWMTQLCHQIRCLRAPDVDPSAFGEITEVVPWDILALDCDQNLNDDQVCSPRLFKSHESRQHIAPGARYVCVVRDPVDVFWSFYNFLPPCMASRGAVTPEDSPSRLRRRRRTADTAGTISSGWYDAARDDRMYYSCVSKTCAKISRRARVSSRNTRGSTTRPTTKSPPCVERSGFEYIARARGPFDDHFVRRKMWTRVGIDESESGERRVGRSARGGREGGRG